MVFEIFMSPALGSDLFRDHVVRRLSFSLSGSHTFVSHIDTLPVVTLYYQNYHMQHVFFQHSSVVLHVEQIIVHYFLGK